MGEGDPAADRPAGPAAPPTPPTTPEHAPLDAGALGKAVVLDRIEQLLEWLLARLRRFRARRGNWWER